MLKFLFCRIIRRFVVRFLLCVFSFFVASWIGLIYAINWFRLLDFLWAHVESLLLARLEVEIQNWNGWCVSCTQYDIWNEQVRQSWQELTVYLFYELKQIFLGYFFFLCCFKVNGCYICRRHHHRFFTVCERLAPPAF